MKALLLVTLVFALSTATALAESIPARPKVYSDAELRRSSPTPRRFITYHINGYPRVGPSCDAAAKAVAARLAKVTGAKIWRAFCSSDNGKAYYFKIVYVGSHLMKRVSTEHDLNDDMIGMYGSREECEREMPFQLDYFRKMTGLEPAVYFCKAAPFFQDRTPWLARIDGFGKARTKPYQLKRLIGYSEPVGGSENVIREIYANAAHHKTPISRVVIARDSLNFWRIKVQYYSEGFGRVEAWDKFIYSSYDQCLASIREARKAFAAIEVRPLTLFCNNFEGPRMHILFDDVNDFSLTEAPQSYETMANCLADRASAIEYFRKVLHWDVRGAICSGYAPEYRMEMFRKLDRGEHSSLTPVEKVLP